MIRVDSCAVLVIVSTVLPMFSMLRVVVAIGHHLHLVILASAFLYKTSWCEKSGGWVAASKLACSLRLGDCLGATQEPACLFQLRGHGAGRCGAGGPFVGDATLRGEEFSGQAGECRVRGCEHLRGGLFGRHAEFLAPADEFSDGPMRLPKRHPL